MTRLRLYTVLLHNLEQKIKPHQGRSYLTKEQAYKTLKAETGQDFGYDVDAWRKWLKENKK